jgi:protein subunit release factor A
VTNKECRETYQIPLIAFRGPEGEEMALLAKAEIMEAREKLPDLEESIVLALTPKDDADERGVVIEVRAGTGNTKKKFRLATAR